MAVKSCFRSLTKVLPTIIGPIIFGLALWSISVELRGYNLGDVLAGMSQIETYKLLMAAAFTGLSYGAVSCYDLISVQHVKADLPFRKIVMAGFITYAISPTIGFPFLTGGALRYRLYSSWGIAARKIARITLFSNFSLWVGLASVAGLVLFLMPSPIPAELDFPFHSFQPVGAVCVLLSVVYLLLCNLIQSPIRFRSYTFYFPSLNIALAQILTFAVDWGFATATLYSLFSFPSGFGYLDFFGVYVIAMVAGLISTVPGGLGVFETILIFFLSPFLNNPIILGTIVIFRLIYYMLPLGIALLLLGWFEIRHRKE